ncbi:MAG: phosphate acetyltransferase [Campylobacterales bacterium]|nr:phosphate acetyltransferase [Campylobacterales bacterium]
MKSKNLYILPIESNVGSLIVSMGMMEFLSRRISKVAYFHPIIKDCNEPDEHITFMKEHFGLDQEYDMCYSYSVKEVEKLVSKGKINQVYEKIIEKYKILEKEYDFVLCEGISKISFSGAIDVDLNVEIGKNIGSSFVSLISGNKKSKEEILDEIKIEIDSIEKEGCKVIASFLNRVDEKIGKDLKEEESKTPLFVLPETPYLSYPTIEEIREKLNGKDIFVNQKDLKNVFSQSKVVAMTLENHLKRMEENDLIVVPGDRSDIIVGSIAAMYSMNYPHISGIVLTGGIKLNKHIKKLVSGFRKLSVPIISVETDTHTTSTHIDNVQAKITSKNIKKIELAKEIFEECIDPEVLENSIEAMESSVMTPAMFEYSLFEKARKAKKKIVLPESLDHRILKAADVLLRRKVVDIVLLGDEEKIRQKMAMEGLKLEGVEIIDPATSDLTEAFVGEFMELRKAKGVTKEQAKDVMANVSYFATMMVHKNIADGMVSGAIHTTADTIRPALQILKTKPETPIVSSLFFMCLETEVLVYGDCAVNQDPTAEELATIAISSSDTASSFGIQPKIAMLSYSTGSSGKGADVEKVIEATKIAKEKRPDLLIEGPIQYDAAIDKDVAKTKLPDSNVAGQATIFVFPDLNTGNNTYKAVQRSSGAVAIGPVLQGLKKPVNDLSRGCLVEDIVNTVAITAIQAQIPEN